jgi:hypothetical protein
MQVTTLLRQFELGLMILNHLKSSHFIHWVKMPLVIQGLKYL